MVFVSSTQAASSGARDRNTMCVNGTLISRKTSIETRNPANRKIYAQQLAHEEPTRISESIEAAGDRRDQAPHCDKQRGRNAAVQPAGH